MKPDKEIKEICLNSCKIKYDPAQELGEEN